MVNINNIVHTDTQSNITFDNPSLFSFTFHINNYSFDEIHRQMFGHGIFFVCFSSTLLHTHPHLHHNRICNFRYLFWNFSIASNFGMVLNINWCGGTAKSGRRQNILSWMKLIFPHFAVSDRSECMKSNIVLHDSYGTL